MENRLFRDNIYSVYVVLFLPYSRKCFIMKISKHSKVEVYSEHAYTNHLDSTIYSYYTWFIHLSILIFDTFQRFLPKKIKQF